MQVESKIILLKALEKAEKASRIPVQSLLNLSPPSPPNLPLSQTATSSFSPSCHQGDGDHSHSLQLQRRGWQETTIPWSSSM